MLLNVCFQSLVHCAHMNNDIYKRMRKKHTHTKCLVDFNQTFLLLIIFYWNCCCCRVVVVVILLRCKSCLFWILSFARLFLLFFFSFFGWWRTLFRSTKKKRLMETIITKHIHWQSVNQQSLPSFFGRSLFFAFLYNIFVQFLSIVADFISTYNNNNNNNKRMWETIHANYGNHCWFFYLVSSLIGTSTGFSQTGSTKRKRTEWGAVDDSYRAHRMKNTFVWVVKLSDVRMLQRLIDVVSVHRHTHG